MSYFTERNGLRETIKSYTSTITVDIYTLLLRCCEKYYDNIAWKFPEQCPDGNGICGIDKDTFYTTIKFEIPSLYRNDREMIDIPQKRNNVYNNSKFDVDEYNQYALLDFIEYIANNCREIIFSKYHAFFNHYDIKFSYFITDDCFKRFQKQINEIFEKTNLLFTLTDRKEIERVVEFDVIEPQDIESIQLIKEKGIRDLLEESIALYKSPDPTNHIYGVEKIWDAFERLKTYYVDLDKKQSANKIVEKISNNEVHHKEMIEKEFIELTSIGNNFRIRHHETSKTDIVDERHYDYFFKRCLSLISLAIQFLDEK